MPPLTKRQFDRWAVRLKWSNLCYVELIPQYMQLFWSLTKSSRDGHMLWSQKQAGNLIFIRGGPAYNLNWVADVFILLYSQFYFSRRLQKTENLWHPGSRRFGKPYACSFLEPRYIMLASWKELFYAVLALSKPAFQQCRSIRTYAHTEWHIWLNSRYQLSRIGEPDDKQNGGQSVRHIAFDTFAWGLGQSDLWLVHGLALTLVLMPTQFSLVKATT